MLCTNKLDSICPKGVYSFSQIGLKENAPSCTHKIRLYMVNNDNHSNLFAQSMTDGKKFYNIDTRVSIEWTITTYNERH